MIDTSTNRPIKVATPFGVGPYLDVPTSQVPAISQALDQAGIRYWVELLSVSINGKPAMTAIHVRKGTDPAFVQSVLSK